MNLILDLLFPKKCVGCRSIGSYLCGDCIRNINQRDLVCPKCERLSVGGQTHPFCRKRFGLDGLWSLGVYRSPLREAIKQLKYKGIKELSTVLVDITLEYWVKYQPFILDQIKKSRGEGWVIVPVPLHWWRENSRGFNQSSLFAKAFAQKLGLEYADALRRTRYTKFQARLKSSERHQNIRNAFEFASNYSLPPNAHCLLIDDVWTTGSTMKECTYILKRNGARQVWGITLAR